MPETTTTDDHSLSVETDGSVSGTVRRELSDGRYVSGSVTSYTFNRGDGTEMNHVPHIVVCEADGAILCEPHANDSQNPQTAIENTVGLVEHIESHEAYFVDV